MVYILMAHILMAHIIMAELDLRDIIDQVNARHTHAHAHAHHEHTHARRRRAIGGRMGRGWGGRRYRFTSTIYY